MGTVTTEWARRAADLGGEHVLQHVAELVGERAASLGLEGGVRTACSCVMAKSSSVRAALLLRCCGVRVVCGQREGGLQPG